MITEGKTPEGSILRTLDEVCIPSCDPERRIRDLEFGGEERH